MKLENLSHFVVVFLVLAALSHAQPASPAKHEASIRPFLGRWDLTLKAPDREYPSWLEVTEEQGQLKAQMVGRWGNARPLPKVEIVAEELTFVSPKEAEDRKDDMVFEAKLVGSRLVGKTTGPDGTPWPWTGERAPALKRAGTPKWGRPVTLFNGKDLSGWKPDKENANAWKVENGTLVSPGHGPELIATRPFGDFKLHIEFNI